jgi:hypothetical protein
MLSYACYTSGRFCGWEEFCNFSWWVSLLRLQRRLVSSVSGHTGIVEPPRFQVELCCGFQNFLRPVWLRWYRWYRWYPKCVTGGVITPGKAVTQPPQTLSFPEGDLNIQVPLEHSSSPSNSPVLNGILEFTILKWNFLGHFLRSPGGGSLSAAGGCWPPPSSWAFWVAVFTWEPSPWSPRTDFIDRNGEIIWDDRSMDHKC